MQAQHIAEELVNEAEQFVFHGFDLDGNSDERSLILHAYKETGVVSQTPAEHVADRESADFIAREVVLRRNPRNAAIPGDAFDDIPLDVIVCKNVNISFFGQIVHVTQLGVCLGLDGRCSGQAAQQPW